jgi:hypothetical protein
VGARRPAKGLGPALGHYVARLLGGRGPSKHDGSGNQMCARRLPDSPGCEGPSVRIEAVTQLDRQTDVVLFPGLSHSRVVGRER